MSDSNEPSETIDDEDGSEGEIKISIEITQLVALAVVFGFLLGAFSLSLAYNSGLVGRQPSRSPAAGVTTPSPSSAAGGTSVAPTDPDLSITDRVSGINATTIATCMETNQPQFLQEIRADRTEGSNVGISGTPGFLIYKTGSGRGQTIAGAQPYRVFETAIEAHLNGESPGNISVDLDTEGEQYLGSNDAPVTLVYWVDYQCPFCKRFDLQVLPRIINNYVDSGKVRIVLKDFAFLGGDSETAALASRCVWEETTKAKFWTWHRTVFENQGGENSGWASKENLVG